MSTFPDGLDNRALKQIIVERVRAEGSVSFAEFMRLALYHPEHGYYFACDPTLDYQSSPNVHPLFGAVLARQLADFWRLLDRPARFDVFEAGAGSGRLAADILGQLRAAEPDVYDATRYVIQDVSLNGARAEAALAQAGLPAAKLGVAIDLPETGSIEGCVLSNELLDALPVHRARMRDGRLRELRVGLDEAGALVDVEAEASGEIEAYFAALGVAPGEGCVAEVNLEAPSWMARAALALRRGYVLTLDYGYEAEALYAPWRRRGTLLTFYRHTSGDDAYTRIGRQDITASVDFTTVQRAGEAAGLTTLGWATQSEFLAALGIGEALAPRPAAGKLEAYYALRRAVVELTDPAGLGRIRVLIQGRNVPATLPAGLRAVSQP